MSGSRTSSLNAYRENKTFVLSQYDAAWESIDPAALGVNVPAWNGFDLALYINAQRLAVEVLVAFRGTDSGIAGLIDWGFGNLSSLGPRWIGVDQYTSANDAFAKIQNWASRRYRDRAVYFTATGHSLGGGLAQHVTRAFPCVRAVVFNSSCVTYETFLAQPFNDAQVVFIHEDEDPLTAACARVFTVTADANIQIYGGANLILKTATGWTIQHSMEGYSAGMSRMVICCWQRHRLKDPGDTSCSCTRKITQPAVQRARNLYCSEHGRELNDPACDFKTRNAARDPSCVRATRKC